MRTVNWYFDFISPYAYIQCMKFPALPTDVQLVVKPLVFGALIEKAGTLGPAEIPVKRTFTYRQGLWLAERHQVPMKLPARHPFNPLPALRLALVSGAEMETVRKIFSFIWGEGRDTSDPAELRILARSLGIEDVESRIGAEAVKAQLRANTDDALSAGVWGVPTFVADGECFWGFDAGPMLLDYLAAPEKFSSGEYARASSLPVGISRKRR
ncbi:MAG: 2-hydroxychromene-2-carboxylate isomerase [Burkholderiales bacterium]